MSTVAAAWFIHGRVEALMAGMATQFHFG